MGVAERWMEAGLIEVPLPSGFMVKVRPVSETQLVTGDLVPYDLIAAIADQGPDSTDTAEVVSKLGGSVSALTARAIRLIWDPEANAWEPITVTAEQLTSGVFPPDDVDALIEAAMTRLNVIAEQEATTREELARFRDHGPGDAAGPDGGAVQPAPVGVDRPHRPAARPRARSGAGVPPPPV